MQQPSRISRFWQTLKSLGGRINLKALGGLLLQKARAGVSRLSGLRPYLAGAQPGLWSTDHVEEIQHYTHWTYCAIRAKCIQAEQAEISVYQVGQRSSKAVLQKHLARWQKRRPLWYKCLGSAGREELRTWVKDASSPADSEDAGKLERIKLPERHPYVRLLHRPNPEQSWSSFVSRGVLQLSLTGSALIWIVRHPVTDVPKELYIIPTAAATPMPPSTEYPHGSYRVSPLATFSTQMEDDFLPPGMLGPLLTTGAIIDARDVKAVRYPHPYYLSDGYSPLYAGRMTIDISEQLDRSRWYQLKNASAPGMVFEIDEDANPSDEEKDAFRADVRARNAGTSNTGKDLILPPGLHAQQIERSMVEMDYVATYPQLRDATLALHQTPPVAIGVADAGTYAAFYASLEQFIELNIQPMLNLFATELNSYLGPLFERALALPAGHRYEVVLKARKHNDPTLVEQQLANDLRSGAMKVNEYRAKRGWPLLPGKEGERLIGAPPPPPPGMGGNPDEQGNEPADASGTGTRTPARDRPGFGNPFKGAPADTITKSADGKPHAFASTQVELPMMPPGAIGQRLLLFAQQIPDRALGPGGREERPHITLLYGLPGDIDTTQVAEVLTRQPPVRATLGKLAVFHNDDADVLHVAVDSLDLEQLHQTMAAQLPHENKYPDYKCHLTLAYLRKGMGKVYEGLSLFAGTELVFSEVILSLADGQRKTIALSGYSTLDRLGMELPALVAAGGTVNGNGKAHTNGHSNGKSWDESKHPRGHAGNPGQFASHGGGYVSPSKAKVQPSPEVDDPADIGGALAKLSRATGRKLTMQDMASLVAAPDDAEVNLDPYYGEHGEGLVITTEGPGLHSVRLLAASDNGDLVMVNHEIMLEDTGKGKGTEMFRRQVEMAKQLGVKTIHAHAAKGPKLNGYYTWPLLGYDQPLDDASWEYEKDTLQKVREKFPGCKSIRDVYAAPGGREWWKENGDDLRHCRFDLTEGSKSLETLHEYLRQRKERKHNAPPAVDSQQGHEEIHLDAAEMEALERAWQRLSARWQSHGGKAWEPEKHPRGHAGNPGQFASRNEAGVPSSHPPAVSQEATPVLAETASAVPEQHGTAVSHEQKRQALDAVMALGKMSWSAIRKAGAVESHIEHAIIEYVSDKISHQVEKLPPKWQALTLGVWKGVRLGFKTAFASYVAAQAAAEKVAKMRGATPEEAKKLRELVTAIDVKTYKPAMVAMEVAGLPGVANFAMSFIPVGSATYLAYSGAAYPLAKLKEAWQRTKAARQQLGTVKSTPSLAPLEAMAEAIHVHGNSDDYIALLMAAFDQTRDLSQALLVANAAWDMPQGKSWDESKHPRGHEGNPGQFSHGGGESVLSWDAMNQVVDGTDWRVINAQPDFIRVRRTDGRTVEVRRNHDGTYTAEISTFRTYTPRRQGTNLNLEVFTAGEKVDAQVVRHNGRTGLTAEEAGELLHNFVKDNPAPKHEESPPPVIHEMPGEPPPTEPQKPKPFLRWLSEQPRGKDKSDKLKAALEKHGLSEGHAKLVWELSHDRKGNIQEKFDAAARYAAKLVRENPETDFTKAHADTKSAALQSTRFDPQQHPRGQPHNAGQFVQHPSAPADALVEQEQAFGLPDGAELQGGVARRLRRSRDVQTGTSIMYHVEKDGAEYFVKHVKGEHWWRDAEQTAARGAVNEVAVAVMAQMAGVSAPPVRRIEFHGRASLVAPWLSGQALADIPPDEQPAAVAALPPEEIGKQVAFSYLADVGDRHEGNYFISADGHLSSIDHEMSGNGIGTDDGLALAQLHKNGLLQSIRRYHEQTSFSNAPHETPLAQDDMAKLLDAAPGMANLLRQLGREEEAAALEYRAGRLKEAVSLTGDAGRATVGSLIFVLRRAVQAPGAAASSVDASATTAPAPAPVSQSAGEDIR